MYECECFFKEHDKHTAWDTVFVELVVVQVSFLRKYEG